MGDNTPANTHRINAPNAIEQAQPLPFPMILVFDHDVALFDAPLRDVIDALGNVQSRLPRHAILSSGTRPPGTHNPGSGTPNLKRRRNHASFPNQALPRRRLRLGVPDPAQPVKGFYARATKM